MRHGFTLIELLVVVLIIGILAAIALPQYRVAVAKTRFIELQTLGMALRRAEQLYYIANGTYTEDLEELDIDVPGSKNNLKTIVEGSKYVCSVTTVYNEVACSSKIDTNVPKFFAYFSENKIVRCRANNQIQEKVCQAVGGKHYQTSESGGYVEYQL